MEQPRLLADAMLGGLVRWLRVLDCDTAYDPALTDAELVALAARESRTLLTRDRHLLTFLRPRSALRIRHDAPLQQLRQVVDTCAITPPPTLFRRCLVCNSPLRQASDEQVAKAPPSARAFAEPMRHCPVCDRLYWLGSHTRRMRATLARTFPEWSALRGNEP
ncbi:hypothetical protein DN826_08645 [Stutzerimonas nosocomialis]|uniref:Mut7-C RNAse domain-containing protein n=1 Tax=Stutzerimonas nosocomialis TaxID=1056496 RepID=UPI00110896BC|nr:Mut7-C RNAse domain-containing protein [Stutzerimonas nosocomialis]TLX57494.1 hypothetical protein DN826_08645 [Stutzerimonas nosocomialis]